MRRISNVANEPHRKASKRFDTVWKTSLLFKLIKAVPGLCDLVGNMLSGRLFQMLVNEQRNQLKKFNNGLH